ncbi:MAG TPA: general secretion pathway protein GspB [Gammaproteobacteria bacterium]|nr:general secretion pathway protein GspB [Gammaproteobacteria bacterium]
MNHSHSPSLLGILIAGLVWPSYAAPLVDPTKPPDFKTVAPAAASTEIAEEVTNFRLNAVKVGAKLRWAIINSERVEEGDKIGPAQVLRIQPDRVLIDYNGQKITLSLLSNDVKTPSHAAHTRGKQP